MNSTNLQMVIQCLPAKLLLFLPKTHTHTRHQHALLRHVHAYARTHAHTHAHVYTHSHAHAHAQSGTLLKKWPNFVDIFLLCCSSSCSSILFSSLMQRLKVCRDCAVSMSSRSTDFTLNFCSPASLFSCSFSHSRSHLASCRRAVPQFRTACAHVCSLVSLTFVSTITEHASLEHVQRIRQRGGAENRDRQGACWCKALCCHTRVGSGLHTRPVVKR